MINNDVLRRLRYALDLNDAAMIEVFALGAATVSPDELTALLLKEEQDGFVELDDERLDAFLDGLITSRRGKREGPTPEKELPVRLTNNAILRKLKIALNFKEDQMIEVFQLADFRISRGELSAFFRQRGHKNYRDCGDQAVRNFLVGLVKQLRG